MTNSFTPRTPSSAVLTSTSAPSATDSAVDSYTLATLIAEAADDRKGGDIVLLNVADVSYLADYFVVATGFSNVQVRAIARSIQDQVLEERGQAPTHLEGLDEGNWIVLDYGTVIAHIFSPKEREFYNLEAFWGHAERIPFPIQSRG